MAGIAAPWSGTIVGSGTRTVPRATPRPMQGVDPITGVPIPLQEPVESLPESQLEKDARQGMTLDKPNAIPVERLGTGGDGNNRREKNCKCPASHLCHGKPSVQKRSERGLQYQLYIANLYSVPLVFSNLGLAESGKTYEVTEWAFNGVDDYDGVWPNKCVLVEAKDRYEHMFKFDWFNPDKEITRWVKQMNKQLNGVIPSWNVKNSKTKKVELEWHYSESKVANKARSDLRIAKLISKGLKVKHTEFLTKETLKERENQRKKDFEENVKRGYGV